MYRAVLGLFLAVATPAAALASGKPDPSFGNDGAVIIHADYEQPFGSEYATDMLIDHVGRYVTVGFAYFGPSKENFKLGLIARHLPDGTPDAGFNGSGYVHLLWQGYGLFILHANEQPDGKLLIAGRLTDPSFPHLAAELVVCRVDEHGAMDTTFGTAGCRTLDTVGGRPGLESSLDGLELQSDGRILVLGVPIEDPDNPRGFALVRLLPDGSDDLDFGAPSGCPNPSPGCGIAYSPESLGDAIKGAALALDPQQGRIVVGADMNVGTFQLVTAFRYTENGTLETIFEPQNFDGLTGDPDTTHEATDVEVTPDSSVLLTGRLSFDSKSVVAVARFRADGVHDSLFGNAGRAVYRFDAQADRNDSRASVLQSDGELLVTGNSGSAASRCHVLRIDSAAGSLDAAFGSNGVATSATLNALSPQDCYATSVVSDGRHVLVAGTGTASSLDINPFLLRLDRDGLFADGLED